jgi:hypothetical protein
MGLNAIGRGTLTVEDSTLYGNALVRLRSDYGSTWEGELIIRNCRWVPACGEETVPHMIDVRNDGMHDFGYPCTMPREITVDGLIVDDRNHPEDYEGMFLFTDPDQTHMDDGATALPDTRPYPYRRCETVTIRGLSTMTGKPPRVSPNAAMQDALTVVEKA